VKRPSARTYREKEHFEALGDLARRFSHVEMTWLLYIAGAATVKGTGGINQSINQDFLIQTAKIHRTKTTEKQWREETIL
jgi:hypothetical protein